MANVNGNTLELDLRGLKCPLPALRAAKALRGVAAGREIVVRCTDPLAVIDIPHLVAQRGDVLLETSQVDDELIFRIRKSPAAPAP